MLLIEYRSCLLYTITALNLNSLTIKDRYY